MTRNKSLGVEGETCILSRDQVNKDTPTCQRTNGYQQRPGPVIVRLWNDRQTERQACRQSDRQTYLGEALNIVLMTRFRKEGG